jgi:DNA repair/transcription protein MET18/MMS19
MTRFRTTDAAGIAATVFANYEDLQRQPASARLQLYRLIDTLLSKHRSSLRNTGDDFIEGYIMLSSMEKDPRNLMINFSILQVIIAEWDISTKVDDLWEAVIKYFPITFRTKPNDPIGITADDLKLRLRQCIAATGLFAPLGFPVLIQKLDDQAQPNVRVCVLALSKKTTS